MVDPRRPDVPSGAGTALEPADIPGWPRSQRPVSTTALLSMVLAIATAGLVYELVMAAVASYVLGDSVRQFSLVIGVYLSALGLGAYLSRFAVRHLAITFVEVELATALVGGLSAPILFLAFGYTGSFELILFTLVVLTGALVGIELPLLMRILERRLAFKDLIARALTFDYAGALVGSLAFSLLLVPQLGIARSSVLCGLLNAIVGLASTWLLHGQDAAEQRSLVRARGLALFIVVLLIVSLRYAERAALLGEAAAYPGLPTVVTRSAYQRVVVTDVGDHFELHLNGNLQFSSADEYRYHEALVHPAMSAAGARTRVFVGGGGDGLATREILRWPGVEDVTLVDLDRAVTDLGRLEERLLRLNDGALLDRRVTIVNDDAMAWLARHADRFNVIVLDFPDPTNYSLGKLYSREFYASVERHLTDNGTLVVQASSPFLARNSYWCIVETLESVGFFVRPYWAFVPSFGDWGYALARKRAFSVPSRLPEFRLRYLDPTVLRRLFLFPPDSARLPTRPNRLNNQVLVSYYLDDWPR